MANIQKLPSGNYRIRKTYRGQVYSLTVPYKPRKAEAEQLIAELIGNAPPPSTETLGDCCRAYLTLKSNVLSPSTLRAYRSYLRNTPLSLQNARITALTRTGLQSYINELAGLKSPKTVRNVWAFLSVVIRQYTGQVFELTLPQRVKPQFFVPEDGDVKAILNHARGTEYEVALYLAALGLRRSEILALTPADLSPDDVLTINKAAVQDGQQNWIIKTTKTEGSTRQIPIPHYVAELIREQGYVYRGQHQGITAYLARAQKELGIEHFTLHKLRHYFASQAAAMGISDAMVQKLGGWQSPAIMKRVYTHAQESRMKEESRRMADHISGMTDGVSDGVSDSDRHRGQDNGQS